MLTRFSGGLARIAAMPVSQRDKGIAQRAAKCSAVDVMLAEWDRL